MGHWVPSASLEVAGRKPSGGDDCYDMTIEMQTAVSGSVEGELAVRKLYTRVPVSVVAVSEKLQLLRSDGERSLRAVLERDMRIHPEGVAQALGWMAMPPDERIAWLCELPWPSLVMLLDAARWLACVPLLQSAEHLLRAHLMLDNAVALASAAQRCHAMALLFDAFFLLKAYFCTEGDEVRPRLRYANSKPPRLLARTMVHGPHTVPHEAWRPVRAQCSCLEAPLRTPQPRYVLCTLTRERKPGHTQPCLFRLVSEHDGKLLLFARQRRAGEGDFLIFSPEPRPATQLGGKGEGGGEGGEGGEGGSGERKWGQLSLPAKVGTVILFDLRLEHRGGPNRGQASRPILYLGYTNRWYRDVSNFKEPHSLEWGQTRSRVHRALYARLDSQEYVRRLEHALQARGGNVAALKAQGTLLEEGDGDGVHNLLL